MFYVFKNFAKFTRKHLCQSLCFNKVAGGACNLIKKEILTMMFSCEFCEISKSAFFYRTPPDDCFWNTYGYICIFMLDILNNHNQYLKFFMLLYVVILSSCSFFMIHMDILICWILYNYLTCSKLGIP